MAPSDTDSDIDSFEEWVSETARARDTSEQEIIDRMMSSYWILDELTGMLEENREQRDADAAETRDTAAESSEGGVDRDLIQLLNALVEQGAEGPRREQSTTRDPGAFMEAFREFVEQGGRPSRDPGREFAAEVDALQEAIDQLDERAHRRDRTVPGRRLRRLSEQVAALEDELDDRLGELEDRIDEETDERDHEASRRRLRRLSERVSTLEDDLGDRVGTIEERVDDTDALRSSVSELRKAIEQLDARLDEQASKQQVTELSEELRSTEEALSDQVRTLESGVENDLDSVEEILKYLLNSVDELEGETDSLRHAYAEIRPIVEDHEEAGRLQQINDAANRAGIDTADCEACGNDVDIGLLRRPECPHCDSSFDGLDTRSRLWWTTGTLTSGDPDDDPLPTHADEPSPREPEAASVDRSSDEGVPDFDWIE